MLNTIALITRRATLSTWPVAAARTRHAPSASIAVTITGAISRRRMATSITNMNTVIKYCATCGRLISPNHRNFQERKFCSKSCSSSKPTSFDRDLEECFKTYATARGQVSCGDVQRYFEESGKAPDLSTVDGQKAGLEKAKWRERIRRAGRRAVVFSDEGGTRFESVQDGKRVEPSFAKGEWAVRFVERAAKS